jgi:hypothetical protein
MKKSTKKMEINMKITEKYLREKNACEEGIKYLIENGLIGMEAIQLIEKLIEVDKVDWALWLIVRVMSRKQCIQFACNCARSVLHVFESEYPDDFRPRAAIEEAEKFGTADFNEKICKANADNAANAATYAAATYAAANAATYAAAAAIAATYAAAYAYATYDAATYAANAAAYAANAANAANASKCGKKVKLSDLVRIGIQMIGK